MFLKKGTYMPKIEKIVEHLATIVLLLKQYLKEPDNKLLVKLHKATQILEKSFDEEANHD